MIEMKKFDFARFANFLKWHVATHKSEIIRMTGYVTIVMFLIIRMAHMGSYFSGYQMDMEIPFHLGFFFFIMGFCMCVASAAILKDLNHKGGFIGFSMSPASQLEKYLTLLIYCTVIPFLSVLFSYLIAEILNVILFMIEGNTVERIYFGMIFTEMFPGVFTLEDNSGMIFAMFSISIYVLGGSIFRKMPFISTSAAIFALFVFLVPFISKMLVSVFSGFDSVEEFMKVNENFVQHMGIMADIIMVVLSLLNFYISYRIYKRMQVINNKWLNL